MTTVAQQTLPAPPAVAVAHVVSPARRVLGIVGTRTQVLAALRQLDGLTWETLAGGVPQPRCG